MKCTAIVLAAGKGSRMQSSVQKQFMLLDGFPLLFYCLRTLEQSMVDEIVLVTEENAMEYCQKEIVEKYQFHKTNRIV